MTSVEKRRNFLINLTYFAVILILFYLFIKYAFGILFPFIFAFFIAIILQKPINAIIKKTKMKKGITSVIMVLLVLAVLVAFLVLLGGRIVSGFNSFVSYITVRFSDINWLQKTLYKSVAFLPSFLENSLRDTIDKFIDQLQHVSSKPAGKTGSTSGSFDFSKLFSTSMSGVWNTAKQIPSILLAILITIISCCFMTADYDRIVTMIKNLFPKDKRFLFSKSKRVMFKSIGKLCKAYFILMCITFTELVIGLYLMKLIGIYRGNYIFVIAALTALIDILPVLGLGMVIIPWSLYAFLVGQTGFGVGLLIMYGIMSIIRHIVEPKLVANQLDLPAIVTIMAMYIGLEVFGAIGMFLLPILIFFIKILYDDGVFSMKSRDKMGEEEIADEGGDGDGGGEKQIET